MDFTHVKVGDYVWIDANLRRERIEFVARLTENLIVISDFEKYYKRNGIRYGPYSGCIHGIASSLEVSEWKARKEAKRREEDEREIRYKLEEKKRQELADIFPSHIWVNKSDNAGFYDVCGLTEEQVRLCADILKATEVTSVLP